MKDEVAYDVIRKSKVFRFGTLSMTDEPEIHSLDVPSMEC